MIFRHSVSLLLSSSSVQHDVALGLYGCSLGGSASVTQLLVRAQADAVLHFGTHGSLEFMPGKQVGMSGVCYPDSLIGDLPNLYYYAANNPSEATIAKRRSYANTISYLTPPAENAGLYKGLKARRRPPLLLPASLHVFQQQLHRFCNKHLRL